MKKHLLFLILFLCSSYGLLAQSNNLNEYHLGVYLRDWKASLTNNDGGNGLADNRMYLEIRLDQNGIADQIVNTTSAYDNSVDGIPFLSMNNNHNVPAEWYYSTKYTNPTKPLFGINWAHLYDFYVTGNGKFEISAMSWDECCDNNITWSTSDAQRAIKNEIYDYRAGQVGLPNYIDFAMDNSGDGQINGAYDSNVYLKYFVRPSHGDHVNDPLQFGVLNADATISHKNGNRGNPDPSILGGSFGYVNGWSGFDEFQDSKDVFYEFVLEKAKKVTITTSSTSTNFDTYLHLINLTNNRANYNYLEGNDDGGAVDRTSQIVMDLAPGTYQAIVEGYNTNEGDFEIKITTETVLPNPGVITLYDQSPYDQLQTTREECPGSDPYAYDIQYIPSLTDASSTLVCDLNYAWQRSNNGAAWFNTGDDNEAGSQSYNGRMEGYSTVRFRRAVTACGNTAYSNIVTVTPLTLSLTSGSISGTTAVPSPQEIPLSAIGNISSPTINEKSYFGIVWEQKTNGGDWGPATGSYTNAPTYTPTNLTETTQFRRKASHNCGPSVQASLYTTPITITVIDPNGVINGKVKSPSGAGVAGITVTAQRISGSPPNGLANKIDTAITTSNGSFSLQGLYYGLQTGGSGASAVFKISPSKPDHVFTLEGSNPSESFYDATLTQVSPTQNNIDFIDETVFSVTGNIKQICYDCVVSNGQSLPIYSPIKDVTFRLTDFPVPVDPNDTIPSANFKTGVDGSYAITFEEDNDYKISPRFKNHVFVKKDSVITFGTAIEVANVNFTDTSTNVITGTIKADCDQEIGRAVVQFTQMKQVGNTSVFNTAEFILKDTANVSGIYSKRVPAGHYLVSVTDFIDIPVDGNSVPKYNKAEMVAFFENTDFFPSSAMRMDVTSKDTLFNLVFHEKPQIKVFDLAGPCTKPLNPIFEQGKTKKVAIGVFQGDPNKYVTYNSQTVLGCPIEDDTLTIFTNIESGTAAVELIHVTVNGIDTLTVTPGEPTISGNYEKTLQLGFTDKYDRQGGDASKNDIKPIVTGIKAGVGTFTTVSPEIPFLILRDPPGDKSFSFRSAETSSSTATSFSTKRTNSKEVWVDAKLGVAFEAGLGVSYESKFWANLKGSFAMNSENTSSTEQIITMTNEEAYSTADDAVPGEEGDIYFGGAVNFLYAPVDEISFDASTCSFNSTRDFILAPDGFATDYAYSEYHIKNSIIPDLIAIRDAPATTANEKRKKDNQISVWQQILSENKRLKREAKHHHNISFDGINGPRTSSVTSSATKVSTIEFQMETDSTLAAEIGMELGGSGLSEGGTISLRMQTGNSKVVTNTQETTTGFTIDDGNDGDYFTVDVKTDPVYNTPVFDLIAGASSCPNEVNTQKRDKVVLSTSNYNMTGIPAGSSQLFQLNLANESESSEERTYYLRYVPGQSTSGAQVSIEGLGAGPFDTQLANNATHDFTASVGQFDPNITNFEMFFEVFDECNAGNPSGANFKDNIIVKAQFEDGISPIILSAPENNFAVNATDGPNINYSMSGYDLANLSEISFEYAAASGNSWVTAKTIQKVNLGANSMDSFWPNSLADGAYKFRLKLKKGSKIRYSDIVRGTVDRKGPIAFGAPLPNDFNYALGDEISQTFNENLACTALNNSNFTLTRLSNNSAIPAILGCYQNKIILTPTVDVSGWIGDSVEVSLINIKDAAGNLASQSFDWDFRIGTPVLNTGAFLANVASSPISISGAEEEKSEEKGGNTTSSVNTEINEDANGKLSINFTLSQADTNDVTINFLLAGKAISGEDYTVSGYHTFDGNAGVVKILTGGISKKLYFDPISDTEPELDENILLSIVNGGDYNIGGNNQIELIILNDDAAFNDCENSGNVFNLANNGSGAILPDTYHKLLLESDGNVESPTTVVFKGERSVILKPGFIAENGAVFLATLEDCPNVVASNTVAFQELEKSYVSNEKVETQATQAIISELQEDGNISIGFHNLIEQSLEIKLLDYNAHEVMNLSSDRIFTEGNNEVSVNTNELPSGSYLLIIDGQPYKIHHKIVVND
ncbi:3-coathanger stack domain-containing protein [Arcticibacterium luteifluviistationis]|uniref:Secretion system C-terminal sorting domain-containing protein n=1 Tax=Arcticibacterium luteifluviistationis TaxID=1784714 RepID=A0A2Z4G6N1_9BACT|nr:3-coathanger stack domain-containing protein [Arcticibacterium luteifluviistationis]AWV96770.1 hypothetical protein DJ013_00605 [Arcticibacterium luteifluviistationis]